MRFEFVDLVRVAIEQLRIVMADHKNLETKLLTRFMYDLDQLWHQLRPQPAILLVQNQEP